MSKKLHNHAIPSGRSFIKIKNKRGPNIDPSGTPEFIFTNPTFDHLILLFLYDYEDNLYVRQVIGLKPRKLVT